MAGRRAAMAPYLHVDLHRDRPGVHRLPALQRELQAGALRATRPPWSVADGAALLFLRAQTANEGTLQPAAEARVHLRAGPGSALGAHGPRDLEAGAVFVAGV